MFDVVVHGACYGSSVAPGCHGFVLLIDGGLVELIVPRALLALLLAYNC